METKKPIINAVEFYTAKELAEALAFAVFTLDEYITDKVLAGEADFEEDYAKNMRVLRDLAESAIRGALDEKQFNV